MIIAELRITDSKSGNPVYYLVAKKGEIEMFYSNPNGHLDKFPKNISGAWEFPSEGKEGRVHLKSLNAEKTHRILENMEKVREEKLGERLFQSAGQ